MLNKQKNNIVVKIFIYLLLVLIICSGFWFRIKGISSNHSFWSDEAWVSSLAKDIFNNKIALSSAFENLSYQRMQIITDIFAFKFFGVNEYSARLGSVFWGTLGILFAYLLTKKLSNTYGGLLSAFLYAFLQINLAYSTQAKPYSALESLLLLILYISTFKDSPNKYILMLVLCILSALYNFIGAFFFIILFIDIFEYLKAYLDKSKIFIVLLISIFLIFVWWSKIYLFIPLMLSPKYNWITYIREIFWRHFGIFTLPSIFGFIMIKNKKIKISVFIILGMLLYAWCFVQYSHNVRYLIPIFGLITVFFGVFWAKIGKDIFNNSAIICLSVSLLLYLGGYKIVRKPSIYYTPNAEIFSDVQNADYKNFYREAYKIFPNFNQLPIFVGPSDTLAWYTDKKPTAIFSINTPIKTYVSIVDSWQYGSLSDFIIEKNKYPEGLVIVNDWQSFMPENIKDYVKKNMKLELRVESMPVSPLEKWPLELYSWKNK